MIVISDNKKTTKKSLNKNSFPNEFPFWARLKISKNRSTLVIDEDLAYDKKKKKTVPGFVHREAVSPNKKGNSDYEEIFPNPEKGKNIPMYLKRPKKTPKELFKPHNKNFDMPISLKQRYQKNNKK